MLLCVCICVRVHVCECVVKATVCCCNKGTHDTLSPQGRSLLPCPGPGQRWAGARSAVGTALWEDLSLDRPWVPTSLSVTLSSLAWAGSCPQHTTSPTREGGEEAEGRSCPFLRARPERDTHFLPRPAGQNLDSGHTHCWERSAIFQPSRQSPPRLGASSTKHRKGRPGAREHPTLP